MLRWQHRKKLVFLNISANKTLPAERTIQKVLSISTKTCSQDAWPEALSDPTEVDLKLSYMSRMGVFEKSR